IGSRNDPQYTFSLGQPIELGGKRARRLASARAASRVTAAELEDTRRQVVAQVKKAFTDTLVAEATLALTGENLKALDEVERLQRIRAEKGDISELELTRIQVQRFAFERDAADARQAIAAARIALRAAVGPEAVAPDFAVSGELGFRDVPLDVSVLRRRALDARPDLRAAEAARQRARADRELARANAWWDVTPLVEYQRIGPDNTFGVGVSVPLRVFDRNQGEIARTRAEVDRADALREAAAVQVLADVDAALSRGGLLSLLPLLALLAACNRGPDTAAATAKAEPAAPTRANVSVVVAAPKLQERATSLETSGKAQFNEEALARVQALVTGRVLEVLARPGEIVEPGHRLIV